MDCGQYQEALSGAALGAGSGAEVQAFSLHLEICEGCRRELARRREFLGVLARHAQTQFEAEPSADFNARLRGRIAGEPRRLLGPSWQWLPALAGAAALAALLINPHFWKMRATFNSVTRRDSGSIAAPAAELPSVSNVIATDSTASNGGERPGTRPRNDSRGTPGLHEVGFVTHVPLPTEIRINEQESKSLDSLARALASGKVESESLVAMPREIDQSLEAKALKFPPISFTPLDPGPAAPDDIN